MKVKLDSYPRLNSEVMTPDGLGIAKSISLRGGRGEKIVVVCALETPYKITDPYKGTKEHGFPPYSFGYAYDLCDIQSV